MPSEKEVKFMVTLKAEVIEEKSLKFLCIDTEGDKLRIPLSEDKPKDVKGVFNKLIKKLKSGRFSIEMSEVGPDLFSQVSNEYINQLNRELNEVYDALVDYELIDEEEQGEGDGAAKEESS